MFKKIVAVLVLVFIGLPILGVIVLFFINNFQTFLALLGFLGLGLLILGLASTIVWAIDELFL